MEPNKRRGVQGQSRLWITTGSGSFCSVFPGSIETPIGQASIVNSPFQSRRTASSELAENGAEKGGNICKLAILLEYGTYQMVPFESSIVFQDP